mmetsp:Transcript_2562/g.6965  ORF Transcript_2562/g.6965 Transcript_2562/m.6965 type:complete len:222 (-) Transcript_2562:554-1219(-)
METTTHARSRPCARSTVSALTLDVLVVERSASEMSATCARYGESTTISAGATPCVTSADTTCRTKFDSPGFVRCVASTSCRIAALPPPVASVSSRLSRAAVPHESVSRNTTLRAGSSAVRKARDCSLSHVALIAMCRARTLSLAHCSSPLYTSTLLSCIISSAIRYCTPSLMTACGCATHSRSNKLVEGSLFSSSFSVSPLFMPFMDVRFRAFLTSGASWR